MTEDLRPPPPKADPTTEEAIKMAHAALEHLARRCRALEAERMRLRAENDDLKMQLRPPARRPPAIEPDVRRGLYQSARVDPDLVDTDLPRRPPPVPKVDPIEDAVFITDEEADFSELNEKVELIRDKTGELALKMDQILARLERGDL